MAYYVRRDCSFGVSSSFVLAHVNLTILKRWLFFQTKSRHMANNTVNFPESARFIDQALMFLHTTPKFPLGGYNPAGGCSWLMVMLRHHTK